MKNSMITRFKTPQEMDIRIICKQFGNSRLPKRSAFNPPRHLGSLSNISKIEAKQNGVDIPIEIHYNKSVWSGSSWAVGEIGAAMINPDHPMTITFICEDNANLNMKGQIYDTKYK